MGASLRPDSPSSTDRTRAGRGMPRSTEKMAAESVGAVIAPIRAAWATGSFSTRWQKTATKAIEIRTPTVASSPAMLSEPLMSTHFVLNPPSARMNTRAAKPSAWARAASVMRSPNSSSERPNPRKISSDGRPRREPMRAAATAAMSTTAPSNSMASRLMGDLPEPAYRCNLPERGARAGGYRSDAEASAARMTVDDLLPT